MIITIKDKQFNAKDIKKLYPAGIIKTGFDDETTQISLEWLESEANDEIELVHYAIFVNTTDDKEYSFIYSTKEELFEEIDKLAKQFS